MFRAKGRVWLSGPPFRRWKKGDANPCPHYGELGLKPGTPIVCGDELSESLSARLGEGFHMAKDGLELRGSASATSNIRRRACSRRPSRRRAAPAQRPATGCFGRSCRGARLGALIEQLFRRHRIRLARLDKEMPIRLDGDWAHYLEGFLRADLE